MITITQGQAATESWNLRRARQLVDTAMRPQRITSGLSNASPVPRGFARAGACSLLFWGVILLAILLV